MGGPWSGRTALVTGGNRGLGLETCRRLARLGLSVLLGARDEKEGRAAAQALAGEGLDARVERLDVADDGSVGALLRRLGREGRKVDVLVNNAGVYPPGGVLDASAEAWREAFEVNFWGALRLCRAFVPGMLDAGWGRVVNVSSGSGAFAEGLAGPAPYAVSKAAMNALTVKLASEVRGDVKVNAVCPGWVRTRMGGPAAPRSVEKGADTIVWLATLPAGGPNGGSFRDRRPIGW